MMPLPQDTVRGILVDSRWYSKALQRIIYDTLSSSLVSS